MFKVLETFNISKIDNEYENLCLSIQGDYKEHHYNIEVCKYKEPLTSLYLFSNISEVNYDGIEFDDLNEFKSELEFYIDHNNKEDYYTLEKMAFVVQVVKAFINNEFDKLVTN